MAGQDWKAALEHVRELLPEERKQHPEDVDVLSDLAKSADDLMAKIQKNRSRMSRLKKKRGKAGRGTKEALRMAAGFKGPLAKFSRMLKQAVSELQR
jgi:hypothetical protein